MKKIITLRQALTDKAYFGGQLDGPSWAPWRALLLAIMGEELTPDELAIFTSITNRQSAPTEPVREFTGVHSSARRQEPRDGRPDILYRDLRRSSQRLGSG